MDRMRKLGRNGIFYTDKLELYDVIIIKRHIRTGTATNWQTTYEPYLVVSLKVDPKTPDVISIRNLGKMKSGNSGGMRQSEKEFEIVGKLKNWARKKFNKNDIWNKSINIVHDMIDWYEH